MPESTTKRARPSLLAGGTWVACAVVGRLLTYGGVLALLLVAAFAIAEWSGYGRLVLASWGTASAACIAVGLLLRACGERIGRTLAPPTGSAPR